MSFLTLIDGYNLLFTAGFEGRSRQRGWLEQARQRLLKYLETHLPTDQHARTMVVFDVSVDVLKARQRELNDPRPAKASKSSGTAADGGIQVAFAFNYDEADDMLEEMIRKHATPKSLTVVSSDHRIRKCALARKAISIDSDTFLNRLEQPAKPPISPPQAEALRDTQILSESEVWEWLREFGEDAEN